MSGSASQDCVICRIIREELPTPGGILYRTACWTVTHHHAERGLHAGRLMVSLNRHMGSFAGLTAEEASSLGVVIQQATQALQEIVKPSRVYLASFNEHSGHIHVHLLMRHEDDEVIGPALISKRMSEQSCTLEDAASVANRIKSLMEAPDGLPAAPSSR